MIDLLKSDSVVIVEGKYDKIKLDGIIDAFIIPTNGFGVFKDKEKRELIRKIGLKHGIIILTDSDSAGMQIRSFIKSFCGGADIKNVYLPQVSGKEKRKSTPSKEGFLGVEGFKEEEILKAFKKSGIEFVFEPKKEKITKTDLFLCGLNGWENSKSKRDGLLKRLDLPLGLSSNAFLDAVNSVCTKEEFLNEVAAWQQEADKS